MWAVGAAWCTVGYCCWAYSCVSPKTSPMKILRDNEESALVCHCKCTLLFEIRLFLHVLQHNLFAWCMRCMHLHVILQILFAISWTSTCPIQGKSWFQHPGMEVPPWGDMRSVPSWLYWCLRVSVSDLDRWWGLQPVEDPQVPEKLSCPQCNMKIFKCNLSVWKNVHVTAPVPVVCHNLLTF